MLEGVVVRTVSNFHYVKTPVGEFECTLRGKLKQNTFSLLAGDRVRIEEVSAGKGVIEKILPRKNELERPAVANIDQAVVIFAVKHPDLNPFLLDRFLVFTEKACIKTVICLNKIDLIDLKEAEPLMELYRSIGYAVVLTSAKTQEGIEQLQLLLKDKISVFAGPSGVGKSSLLNTLQPGLELKTGEVSTKLKRGKHTTRYAQLLALDSGGLVVDTPGFSYLQLASVPKEELAHYFPEMEPYFERCKFSRCLHWHEPCCGVKEAVAEGEISQQRYAHYLAFLQEINAQPRRY